MPSINKTFSSDSRVESSMDPVQMMCMTKKQKFEVENPEVVVLSNGRYAYRAMCPWKGKNDRDLYAWKFCGQAAYERWLATKPDESESQEDTEVV